MKRLLIGLLFGSLTALMIILKRAERIKDKGVWEYRPVRRYSGDRFDKAR
jgi:hypothetical protein